MINGPCPLFQGWDEGLNKFYKPSMCRNIGENDENGVEMAQLLDFFRDFAKLTEMAIFYSDLQKKTLRTTDSSDPTNGSVKNKSFLRHRAIYPLHIGTLDNP